MIMTEAWEEFESFADEASAEALAEMLRAEGVPTQVKTRSPVPGVVENVRILVPSNLAHRARFIAASTKVSDEELEKAAIGELPNSD